MAEEIVFMMTGVILGLSAGITPGPLLTLVISETLKHNKAEGIKVAIAPLITDVPIILASFYVLSKISDVNSLLGIISFFGAAFLAYLAIENLSVKSFDTKLKKQKSQSLKKGIITNALNPHPYLFYFTVGGPIALKGLGVNVLTPILFLSAFVVFLVVSKIILAFLVDKSRSILKSNLYIYTIRFLGIVLLTFAFVFIKDGLKFFGLA